MIMPNFLKYVNGSYGDTCTSHLNVQTGQMIPSLDKKNMAQNTKPIVLTVWVLILLTVWFALTSSQTFEVDLSNSGLTSFPLEDGTISVDVTSLDLSGNMFSTVPDLAFKDFSQLQVSSFVC